MQRTDHPQVLFKMGPGPFGIKYLRFSLDILSPSAKKKSPLFSLDIHISGPFTGRRAGRPVLFATYVNSPIHTTRAKEMAKLLSCSQPIPPWLLFYMYYVRTSKAKCYKKTPPPSTEVNPNPNNYPTQLRPRFTWQTNPLWEQPKLCEDFISNPPGRRRILSEESRGPLRFIDWRNTS